MRVLDAGGPEWWHVDVVVRPARPNGPDHDLNDRLVALVADRCVDRPEVPAHVGEPTPAASYDMSPPEGDLGVGLWVLAPGLGAAVEAAWRHVGAALGDIAPAGPPDLWDVRALPLSAVMDRSAYGGDVGCRVDLRAELDTGAGPDLRPGSTTSGRRPRGRSAR